MTENDEDSMGGTTNQSTNTPRDWDVWRREAWCLFSEWKASGCANNDRLSEFVRKVFELVCRNIYIENDIDRRGVFFQALSEFVNLATSEPVNDPVSLLISIAKRRAADFRRLKHNCVPHQPISVYDESIDNDNREPSENIDISNWLATHEGTDALIIEFFLMGDTFESMSNALRVPESTIRKRFKRLCKLGKDWWNYETSRKQTK